jgi:Flp pilus assembly protein TadD
MRKLQTDTRSAVDQGRTLLQAGNVAGAEKIFRSVLAGEPQNVDALHGLAGVALATGHVDAAIELANSALRLRPNSPALSTTLGDALRAAGKAAEAAESYRVALASKARDVHALNNLGLALQDLGQFEEAALQFEKARKAQPRLVEPAANLANALLLCDRVDEALVAYQAALRLAPDEPSILLNYGHALNRACRLPEAWAIYRRRASIVRRSPWYQWPEDGSPRAAARNLLTSQLNTTAFKLEHDIEQFEYLLARNLLPASFNPTVDAYREVLAEIRAQSDSKQVVALTQQQLDRIGEAYNKVVHLADLPALESGALAPRSNWAEVEADYLGPERGIIVLDNFLRPEALQALYRYCLESTIWFDYAHPHAYLGAMQDELFNGPLLQQIATELIAALPQLLHKQPLSAAWAFKYASHDSGTLPHGDEAAVNLNFWLTPDASNLDHDRGGLIVHRAEAPKDWSFQVMNNDQERISRFLAASNEPAVVVPYRQNRAVLFNSDLFHSTDAFRFRAGYEHRRINVTFLFGDR